LRVAVNHTGWLKCGSMSDDDLGADGNAVIQVHDILIDQAKAAGRHRVADSLRLVGSMDSVDRIAEIHGPSSQGVAGTSRHKARQVRLPLDHLRRRNPIGPFGLSRNLQQPSPLKSIPSHTNTIAQRTIATLDDVQKIARMCEQ